MDIVLESGRWNHSFRGNRKVQTINDGGLSKRILKHRTKNTLTTNSFRHSIGLLKSTLHFSPSSEPGRVLYNPLNLFFGTLPSPSVEQIRSTSPTFLGRCKRINQRPKCSCALMKTVKKLRHTHHRLCEPSWKRYSTARAHNLFSILLYSDLHV